MAEFCLETGLPPAVFKSLTIMEYKAFMTAAANRYGSEPSI